MSSSADHSQNDVNEKVEYEPFALLFMILFPCSSLACLEMIRVQVFTRSYKNRVLAFEQYLTALQEVHVKSLIGILKGSFEPVQPKQLSHASIEGSLH